MEIALGLKAVISLAFLFLLMYAALRFLQRYTKFGYNGNVSKDAAINIVLDNIVYVDEITKIVTMTYSKERKYILGISKGNLVVIDKIIDNQSLRIQGDIQ